MKILLKEDVETLGAAGDIVTVADGYARNYLVPQGLAVKATAGQVKQVDVIRRQARLKRERIESELAALAEKLTGTQLEFEVNASERGRLYGSVTQEDVAAALEAKLGEPIDRRKLDTGPLRQIGLHTIPVRLGGELAPQISVILYREGEDPASYLPVLEEPAGPEAEAAETEASADYEAEAVAAEVDSVAEVAETEATNEAEGGEDSAQE